MRRAPQARTLYAVRNFLGSAAGLMLVLLAVLAATALPRAETASDGLRPGEFIWSPELAPRGPVAVIVSLPRQRAYVYRNGVRIGISTVSTGRTGYETPSGIYTILQKRREHYSNLYDDAPMPFMQRLTWDGLALHAGGLPGYPASHGCVRLPGEFAERLFAATGPGTVVVIAAAETFPPSVVSPGLFSPIDPATGAARTPVPVPAPGEWFPDRAPDGPLTILLSISDRELVVLRNAIEIGRAPIAVEPGFPAIGTRAYMLLEGTRREPSAVLPDRPARPWLALSLPDGAGASEEFLRSAFETGRIVVPREFAQVVHAALRPGTTVVLTDEPLQSRGDSVDVLTAGNAR